MIRGSHEGITLVEIMIAVAIIAIIVLVIAGMQGTALRANTQAQRLQTATSLAEGELELQRQRPPAARLRARCEIDRVGLSNFAGYTCVVSAYPCRYSNNILSCQANGVSDPVAYQVIVEVSGPANTVVTLQTVVAR